MFYLLYVLYNYLYSTSDLNDFMVYNGIHLGRTLLGEGLIIKNSEKEQKIFNIATGSEFSISFWIYYKDPSYNAMKNKFIFSLGSPLSPNNSQSILVYLGGSTNTLVVDTNTLPSLYMNSQQKPLDFSVVDPLFNNVSGAAQDPRDRDSSCNMTTIDLQKWVLVNIVSTQRTLDVFIDGKLGRSCILPSNIIIPKNYQLNMFEYGGFGGYVSNFSVHDYALNPEQTWRMYMAGPGFKYGIWAYIKSLFDPKSAPTYTYPAYPGSS